jgi:hypothetical protein
MFLDSEGVIHVNFLPHGAAVNAQCYSSLPCNDVHQVVQKKRPGKFSQKINLQDDSACTHITDFTSSTVGWEIVIHPPYSHDLPPVIFVRLDQRRCA